MPRFSDDLDFTAQTRIKINGLIKALSKDLILFGINNKIDKLKQTNFSISFRISAEGPLFKDEKTRCFVRIEISLREKASLFEIKEYSPIYPDIPLFTLPVMKKEEIAAEKVRAILTRNYARDVFDLWFLLKQKTKINKQLIERKLNFYDKRFDFNEFKKKIEEKKIYGEQSFYLC